MTNDMPLKPGAQPYAFWPRFHEIKAAATELGAVRYLLSHPAIPGFLLRSLHPNYGISLDPLDSAVSQTQEVRSEKTIWTYWDQGVHSIPDFNRLCILTWRHHCPDWDVLVLDRDSVFDFLDSTDLPPRWSDIEIGQQKSDLVRLALLARYGGVWMDSSILLQQCLDELAWNRIESNEADLAGFSIRRFSRAGDDDIFESWFIASRQGGYLMRRWHEAFNELWADRLNISGIMEESVFEGVDLQNIQNQAYLCLHCVLQALVQKEPECRLAFVERTWMTPADNTAFRWQDQHGFTRASALSLLGKEYEVGHFEGVPLLKFTGWPAGRLYGQLHYKDLLSPHHTLGRLLRHNLPSDFEPSRRTGR